MTIPSPRPASGSPLPLSHRRRDAFCSVVQGRRQARGLSLSTVADIIGLPPQRVTDIETGTDLLGLDLPDAPGAQRGLEYIHSRIADLPAKHPGTVQASDPAGRAIRPMQTEAPRRGVAVAAGTLAGPSTRWEGLRQGPGAEVTTTTQT